MDKSIPQHVAIVMDGNGRWAKKRGLPRSMGHKKGIEIVEKVLEFSQKYKIKVLSLFAFSTENWSRDEKEVKFLFDAFLEYLKKKKSKLIAEKIRFVVSGRRDGLPQNLVEVIEDVEKATAINDDFILNIAFNYGGRAEIIDAVKKIVKDVDADIDSINETSFRDYLYNPLVPDVDLMIRTSGESRISNFLLWQLAYAELYFTNDLWPDFGEEEYKKALDEFGGRQRRFGIESN